MSKDELLAMLIEDGSVVQIGPDDYMQPGGPLIHARGQDVYDLWNMSFQDPKWKSPGC